MSSTSTPEQDLASNRSLRHLTVGTMTAGSLLTIFSGIWIAGKEKDYQTGNALFAAGVASFALSMTVSYVWPRPATAESAAPPDAADLREQWVQAMDSNDLDGAVKLQSQIDDNLGVSTYKIKN
jgi:hypothetical protein